MKTDEQASTAAIAENHPDTVMVWYLHLPSTNERPNWWFDRIVADAEKLGVNGKSVQTIIQFRVLMMSSCSRAEEGPRP